ncbi:MAG: hypothetical protein GX766_07390 [Firmicutes bacterium]|nr:hypothetical protein [Bacillota bacterium]HOB21703.1 hypothetical protein [Bacillota bacterium]HQD39165.1 hypothetical protein [Bacillota bacterium]
MKTSWIVAGTGAVVSALGWRMLPKKTGAGILGFGLAHVILGLADRLRPTIRQ